jgi:hypothetical protein
MQINVLFDQPTNTLPAGFVAGVNQVARFYDTQVTNNITYNLHVGFGTFGPNRNMPVTGLGNSNTILQQFSYAELRNAWVASATSADDMTALGNVPAVDPIAGAHQYYASTVQAKALGLIPNTMVEDQYIGLSNTTNFDYDPSTPPTMNQFDFAGVVAHEIAETLGKNILVGGQAGAQTGPLNGYDLSDLFHYSALGVRDLLGTTPGYFSINGGATNLNNFNTDPMGDWGDWASPPNAAPDSWLAFSGRGVRNPVTPTDLRFLDVIGYGVAALPPPTQAPLPPGKIFLRSDAGQDAFWVMDQNLARVGPGANLAQADPSWQVRALADVDSKGPNFSDLIWQNTNGTVATWQLQSDSSGNTVRVGTGNNLGSVDPSWQVVRTAGDFDGNGVADVLFQNRNGQLAIWELQNSPTGPIAFPNNQNQFNIAQNPGSTWHAFAAGDFNGSGTAGILFFNDNRMNYSIWDMQPGTTIGQNGMFTFNEQVNLPAQDPSWSVAGVGDFNGAGTADILWRNTNGQVAVWEMTGTADNRSVAIQGQFNIVQPGTNTPQLVDPSWTVAAVRDFSTDGRAGILWQNNNGQTAIWENFTEGPLGSGQASFTVQQNLNPSPNPPGVLDWRVA